MEINNLFYRKGYKYQLSENFAIQLISINVKDNIDTKYISLSPGGWLIVFTGYAWDGASGPTYDSKNTIRGSLVHDVIYQLIRYGLLPFEYWKKADKELYRICRLDGMSWIRARLWMQGLKLAGGSAAKPKNKNAILVAP